jgi:cytochrome c-type biogenesis protein CcmH/NrfG
MKKNREVLKPEIRLKNEKENIQRGVSKGNVILIGFVCLIVGFILGATVAILKTSTEPKLATSVEEPKQTRSIDNEEEIQLSKSILEKDPNNVQALINLGNAYFDTERYQEAIDAYSRALVINPKNSDVRTDLGIMYRKSGQFDKALETFRRAAQDNPRHLNSRFNLGIVLEYDKKDFQAAIQAWEDFLKVVSPDDERVTMVRQEIQAMKAAVSKK